MAPTLAPSGAVLGGARFPQPGGLDEEGLGRLLVIAGVTRDSTGVALASCAVHLLRATDDFLIDQQTSDASGNYRFVTANGSDTYYVVAYKPGSPDVAGTTANTLVATPG